MSNGSNSLGGSFRSRQSTMSNATTAESAGERGSSVTTEETEIPTRLTEDAESLMASYRLRRSRTRWTDDYGLENELVSQEVANLTKPFRGRCFIRCSPEKLSSDTSCGRQHHDLISYETSTRESHSSGCCERCWYNPETPYCDLCLTDHSQNPYRNRTIAVRAVIESSPNFNVTQLYSLQSKSRVDFRFLYRRKTSVNI